MDLIRLGKPFAIMHVHSGHLFHLDVSSYFLSTLPLHFKLLDSPSWLSVNAQGLVSGTVPAVKRETQVAVTVAAWHGSDLLTAKLAITVLPADLFDSFSNPILELNMRNRPFPVKTTHVTREVLSYIFGYYHHKPHGEQFFEKLREKANQFNQHLPTVASLENVVEIFEHLVPEEQQSILEYAVEPGVLAEAERQAAELQEHPEPEPQHTETESLGMPEHEAHERSLLEHLYAYLEANHSESLHELLHHELAEPHEELPEEITFENFVEMLETKEPKLEDKLKELEAKHPVLSTLRFTDEELQESYLVKELEIEAHTAEHIVFEEEWEELFASLEKKAIAYREAHPLETPSQQPFYPHPTPP